MSDFDNLDVTSEYTEIEPETRTEQFLAGNPNSLNPETRIEKFINDINSNLSDLEQTLSYKHLTTILGTTDAVSIPNGAKELNIKTFFNGLTEETNIILNSFYNSSKIVKSLCAYLDANTNYYVILNISNSSISLRGAYSKGENKTSDAQVFIYYR